MLPYFLLRRSISSALYYSVGLTVLILLCFGFLKGYLTGERMKGRLVSALQSLAVGLFAAGSSYGLIKGISMLDKEGVSNCASQ